jgi:hypothetical protein
MTNPLDELKTLYSEANNNFRFFLTWRQLLLAGFFAVFAAVALAFRWSLQHNPGEASIIPFVGTTVSLMLWLLDYRNYQLVEFAAAAGSAIEKEIGDPHLGYFVTFNEGMAISKKDHGKEWFKKRWIRHRVILNIIYFGGAALMLAAAIICLATGYCIKPDSPATGSPA